MLASLNSLYDEYKISGKKDPGEVIASATSNFTTLELSSFFADNFKEACNSDIGLMLHGITARGNLMHLFKGDIYSETIQNFLPRSLDSKAYLSKASVSGATLLEILKHPSNNNAGTCDGVYAVSGLKVSYAPWASTRFISATLSDGTPLENDKTYTIAYWDGTVDKSYLSDAQNTTYNSFVPFITERLKTLKTVTPYNDNRYNLDWNKLD
jgi:raffinose/stachyose/melibiose transport system substrate-binding protein